MRMTLRSDTARVAAVEPAVLREADAPGGASHERPSGLVRQALEFAGRSAKSGHAWAGVAALAIVGASLLGWRYLDGVEQCDPTLSDYLLTQHALGEREAAALESRGEHATAEAIRELTSIENAPDSARLCTLLITRLERGR